MSDVAIVGGGPGGLYAARHLASRGFRVSVFEEHLTPGKPVHCTGVLAAEAFDEFGLRRDAILNGLTTAQFFAPSGRSIAYSTTRTEALVIDRDRFDATLAEEARAAGAAIHTAERVTNVRLSAGDVVVERAGAAPVTAAVCILACGANYVLQRRLGLGMPRLHLQSAQTEMPCERPGMVELHFGNDVAPKGFAWVVPVVRGDRTFARVGLMCDHDARTFFARFADRVALRWHTRPAHCSGDGPVPRAKMLPLSPIPKTYAARVLAVGDAAGLVKATTGGGIYYSLLSGRLAAETIAAGLESGDVGLRGLAPYEERWRAALGDELDAQLKLREIAQHLSDEEIDSLFHLAETDGIMPLVRRTARFNRHRDVIVALLSHPPARRVLMRRVLGWSRTA